MPIIHFSEFEQFKAQGYKGTFVGGCVERGDGSSFRAKAHAHNEPYIKAGNEIVKDEQNRSNLMWYELCHILTPGHSHDAELREVLRTRNPIEWKEITERARARLKQGVKK